MMRMRTTRDLIDPVWYVYMIRCTDRALYTGMALDADRRFTQHSLGAGAKFFRMHTALCLTYREGPMKFVDASRREREIKRLPKAQKEELARKGYNAERKADGKRPLRTMII